MSDFYGESAQGQSYGGDFISDLHAGMRAGSVQGTRDADQISQELNQLEDQLESRIQRAYHEINAMQSEGGEVSVEANVAGAITNLVLNSQAMTYEPSVLATLIMETVNATLALVRPEVAAKHPFFFTPRHYTPPREIPAPIVSPAPGQSTVGYTRGNNMQRTDDEDSIW